jgi:HlyD family secretion protein
MKSNVRKIFTPVALAVLTALGFTWIMNNGRSSDGSAYRTVPVKHGDLFATINATGTLQPEEVIDVGAQVAGQISSFGSDKTGKSIDYGSMVEAETVLARIDDSLYAADVAMADAQLQQAQAGVTRAEADLGQLKAKLYQAERDWERARKLGPSDALAEASYDAYRSAYETAKANLAVGEAAIQQARETVAHAEATLQRARRNLGYCTIKSPVNGVIIDRRVNIGQTVVASLNAPSLFLIAKDLKRMQVWVSVNEADIGAIHPGQPVRFSVDAYPGEIVPRRGGENTTQRIHDTKCGQLCRRSHNR